MNSQLVSRESFLDSERGDPCLDTPSVRVLLVDDFEPFRSLVSMMLRSTRSFEIIGEAADGLSAVQRAEELRPDLVLLDMDLPGIHGIEVARHVRRVSPSSKILFVSAGMFPDQAQAALDTGASGYVVKFEVARELLTAIETVLKGKQFVSDTLARLDLEGKFSEQRLPWPADLEWCRARAKPLFSDRSCRK